MVWLLKFTNANIILHVQRSQLKDTSLWFQPFLVKDHHRACETAQRRLYVPRKREQASLPARILKWAERVIGVSKQHTHKMVFDRYKQKKDSANVDGSRFFGEFVFHYHYWTQIIILIAFIMIGMAKF